MLFASLAALRPARAARRATSRRRAAEPMARPDAPTGGPVTCCRPARRCRASPTTPSSSARSGSSTGSATARSRRTAASSRAAPARPPARPSMFWSFGAAPVVDNFAVVGTALRARRRRWRRHLTPRTDHPLADRLDPGRRALQRDPPHHLRAGHGDVRGRAAHVGRRARRSARARPRR